jgi:hypothetical protein
MPGKLNWPRSLQSGVSRWWSYPPPTVGVTAFPGLIVKDSYWRWPERDQAGNTIDFYVQVLGLSFHEAMKTIVAS